MNTSPIQLARELIVAARDDLRERREARLAQDSLRRELASYTSPADIADLLGVISEQDSPEAQQVRDVLSENLRSATLRRAA